MSTDKPLLATLTRHIHLIIRRQVHADVRAAGFGDLTPAHLYVFQLPGPDGIRPTELAARMNMTKQAANHLLSGLEALGYIQRVAAAGDGRGKVLRLTARGREVTRIMNDSAMRLEDEWARRLGDQVLERLRQDLADLADIADDSASLPTGITLLTNPTGRRSVGCGTGAWTRIQCGLSRRARLRRTDARAGHRAAGRCARETVSRSAQPGWLLGAWRRRL